MPKTEVRTKSFIKSTVVPRPVLRRFVDAVEDLLESLEYASPEFWKETEAARRSGRISGERVKKELGINV